MLKDCSANAAKVILQTSFEAEIESSVLFTAHLSDDILDILVSVNHSDSVRLTYS